MATLITDLRDSLKREINPPGFEQFADISGSQLDGYLEDGFWEARLAGILSSYTMINGDDLTPAGNATDRYIVVEGSTYPDDSTTDLPEHLEMLVVILAGFRLLRSKIMSLATNFRAQAGPVEYQQESSATVLRALLSSLQDRVKELKIIYSTEFSGAPLIYMDGVLQRESYYLDTTILL